MVEGKEFTKEQVLQDIDFCNKNAYTRKLMDDHYFENNPHIYINSSDRIRSVVEPEVKEGDHILTVASCGDYQLDSVLYGAKDVTNYDINRLQYYALCLKTWAVQNLNYQEFISCFTKFDTNDELNYMSPELLQKAIATFEQEPAYAFWQAFIEERKRERDIFEKWFQSSSYQIACTMDPQLVTLSKCELSFIFHTKLDSYMNGNSTALRILEIPFSDSKICGYTASKENFNLLKDKLQSARLQFVTSDIKNLKEHLKDDSHYDHIFLSNIPFYVKPDTFIDTVENQFVPILLNQGSIIYYCQNMRKFWFEQKRRNKSFHLAPNLFKSGYLKSVYSEGAENCLQQYRKLPRKKYIISLEEVPTYNGTPDIDSTVDTKVKIKIK